MASAEPAPQKLPKTADKAFSVIAFGVFLLTFAGLFLLGRKQDPGGHLKYVEGVQLTSPQSFSLQKNNFWALVLMASLIGLSIGFAVPLLASYQTKTVFQPVLNERTSAEVLEITPAVVASPSSANQDLKRDTEVAKLVARNRRLKVLVETLQRDNAKNGPSKTIHELGPQAEW